MTTHVKVLAWIHIVFGALGVVGAAVILLFFGGLAAFVGSQPMDEAPMAVPILGGIGGIVFVIVLAISLPGLIAGIGLLEFRPWARILTIILCAVHLLNVPIGTALGIYGLWVLLNRQTEFLFSRPMAAQG